jgi:hypothetical protein
LEYAVRFLAGGLIVSAFAVLGDVLRPKSFAGLFAAAPSVALATLTIALVKNGTYAAIEARSMAWGGIAFLLYAFLVCHLVMRFRFSALAATSSMLVVWLIAALSLERVFVG